MQYDLPNQITLTSPNVQQNSSDLSDTMFNIGKSSKYLGVSIDTLRRWEAKGKIVSHRSPGGHRYFLKEELDKVFDTKYSRNRPPLSVQNIPAAPKIDVSTTPDNASSVQAEPVQTAPAIQGTEVPSTPTNNSAPSFRPAVVEEPFQTQSAPVVAPAVEPLPPVVETPVVQTTPPPPISTNVFYPPEPISFANQTQPVPVATQQVQSPQPSFSGAPIPTPVEIVQTPPTENVAVSVAEQPPVLTPIASIPPMDSNVSSSILPPRKPQTDKLALVRKISLVAIILFVLVDIILVFIWYQGSVAVPIP